MNIGRMIMKGSVLLNLVYILKRFQQESKMGSLDLTHLTTGFLKLKNLLSQTFQVKIPRNDLRARKSALDNII